jgi:hypothetical protein
MAKFRVTYVAVRHEHSHRDRPDKGTRELLDDRIAYRDEKTVSIEANDESEALAKIKATVPADCEFTGQASRLDGRL